MKTFILTAMLLCGFAMLNAQTVYVPSGTGGIGTSTNSYVGIGSTSTPTAKLQVVSTSERESFRVQMNTNSSKYLNIWQGSGAAILDPIGTGLLYLGYDQATDVMIGNGKLGIGTVTPANTLTVRGRLGIRAGGEPSTAFEPLRVEGGFTAEEDVVNVTNLTDQNFIIRLSQAGASTKRTFIGTSTSTRISMGVGTGNEQLTIINGGNVGIGTTAPDAKLTVKGGIHAREVLIDLNGAIAPDYVFENEYKLPSLETIKKYINDNHHLPEVPSAKQMEEKGMNVVEMNLLLLKKVEELTLYVIELKEENDLLRVMIGKLEK